MKKLSYLLGLILFFSFTFTSCDKIEDATTVDFTVSYDADLNIDVGARNEDGTFSAYASIDPTSDSEFNKYINKIKDIKVEMITGTVVSTNPNFTLLDADLRIYNDRHSAEWTYSNVPVTVGTSLSLGNEKGQWDTVSQIALDKHVYNLSLIGTVDVDDLNCKIVITITYKITAGVL
jgi:hypothetical protein